MNIVINLTGPILGSYEAKRYKSTEMSMASVRSPRNVQRYTYDTNRYEQKLNEVHELSIVVSSINDDHGPESGARIMPSRNMSSWRPVKSH